MSLEVKALLDCPPLAACLRDGIQQYHRILDQFDHSRSSSFDDDHDDTHF